jgi:hypothetical protein
LTNVRGVMPLPVLPLLEYQWKLDLASQIGQQGHHNVFPSLEAF